MSEASEFLPLSLWNQQLFTGNWTTGPLPAQQVTEPATGDVLGQIAMANAEFVSQRCQSARAVQSEWAALAYDEKATILRKAAAVAEQNFAAIVDWLIKESGSIRPKAEFEVSLSIKVLHEAASMPSRAQGEVLPSAAGRLSLARRRPLGVVGVISPFNFPLYLAIRAVAPAIAAGNSVVLKPDPRTAVSGGYTIARIFQLAGLPAGVLQVLPGDGAAGAALVSDPEVAMIQFTGSTGAGRKVGEAAGKHLKKVSLELGGKNSLIILDDADLDIALANATWGVYLHQGQICMSTGRVLVQRGIYDEFLKRLTAKAKSLPVGNPATQQVALGPLINESQRDNAARLVSEGVKAGAVLEAGGQYDGLFFQPTVLSGVSRDNPVFNEEIFGPVAVVVPFDTDEEAIELANDTEYGLSAAVISSNVGRALNLGEQLKTGLLHINDQTVNDEVVNPFGGVGASGNGTSVGGPASIDEFTQWQWLTVKGEAPMYPL
ncbi:MAG: benzaldehyde dehydrogenase [Oceanospirillaceae bacterium]|nr:benzaldehyde dehydrogenase [Oceanospirillaceae bacterium]MBT11973.1 benzaldehyde dehydrogenase [Oceanospirillaceae bacterium]